MKRSILVCALLLAASIALAAQQPTQSGAYEGTSNPPSDGTITTFKPKPPAGRPAVPARQQDNMDQAAQDNALPQPTSPESAASSPQPSACQGTAEIAPNSAAQPATGANSQPALSARAYRNDPDGDIVHPVGRPGELIEGTAIRARLLDRLSTMDSQSGDAFRATVASDVMQGGQILIPAGAEIDGFVVRASAGHLGGHSALLLRPQTVTLADGQHYKLFAQLSDAPGSRTRIMGEGEVRPGSRLKKDGIEYGGAVGAGVVTGAILGGPAGALAGTIVGAGAVTVHLLMDRPQATLDSGTVLVFTLSQPLDLVPAGPSSGN